MEAFSFKSILVSLAAVIKISKQSKTSKYE
jgi:hypothetical protein